VLGNSDLNEPDDLPRRRRATGSSKKWAVASVRYACTGSQVSRTVTVPQDCTFQELLECICKQEATHRGEEWNTTDGKEILIDSVPIDLETPLLEKWTRGLICEVRLAGQSPIEWLVSVGFLKGRPFV
jgi:hypothetical protein